MKHVGTILVCMAGCVGFGAMAGPDAIAQTNNPYTVISTRNVFDLGSPAPSAETATTNGPLPKITLVGLTTILGDWSVLFKVGEVNPAGVVVKEQSRILREGESEDGIKVAGIDPVAGAVIFVNHGTVQEISLSNNTKLPVYMAKASYGDTLPKSYPPEFIRARTPDYLGGGPGGFSSGAPITNLEDRITLIEAQRAYLKDNHDPAADSLPPTAATPEDTDPGSSANHTPRQK